MSSSTKFCKESDGEASGIESCRLERLEDWQIGVRKPNSTT